MTNLVVECYHQISGHSGREYVISLARKKVWIVNAGSVVRKALSKCFSCRRRQGPFCEQKMADRTMDRVTPGQQPFTSVGIDCFGLLQGHRSQSPLTRYGVIFTCLVIPRSTHRSRPQFGAQKVYSKKRPGKGDQIRQWYQLHRRREGAEGIHQRMESQQDSRSTTP